MLDAAHREGPLMLLYKATSRGSSHVARPTARDHLPHCTSAPSPQSGSPTLSLQVSDRALTSFNIQPQGRVVSVGDERGSVHVLELSESLVGLQAGEKQAIQQLFEREFKREKNLEARAREAKVRGVAQRVGVCGVWGG